MIMFDRTRGTGIVCAIVVCCGWLAAFGIDWKYDQTDRTGLYAAATTHSSVCSETVDARPSVVATSASASTSDGFEARILAIAEKWGLNLSFEPVGFCLIFR